jgi:hypothetical protein
MTPEHEELIEGYLAHAEARCLHGDDGDLAPAWWQMRDLVERDPEAAWLVVVEMVQRITRDEVLAYVAAGPLEDLLCGHPRTFIDRVESLAGSDAKFRRALSGVWPRTDVPEDVVARIDAVLGDEPRL